MNIPEEFFKFLDDTGRHVSNDAIAAYVKSFNRLKDKESVFIDEHLSSCSECLEKFKIIFDEELDLDEKKKISEINIDLASENSLNFIGNETTTDGIIRREDNRFHLTFIKLPGFLENRNIRISFAGTSLIGRIVSVKLNNQYMLGSDDNLNLKEISKVYLEYVDKQTAVFFNNEEVKKSGSPAKYFLYSAIIILAAILIYIFFIPLNQIKQAKVADYKKKINAVTDSEGIKTESIQKDSIKGDAIAVKKNDSSNTSIAKKVKPVKIIIPSEFKYNYYLEGLVNKSEKSNIIISPAIGDTLTRQITFRWAPLDSENYLIVIVDNKNKEIWSKDISDNRVTLLQKLEPGIYYWKVNSEVKLEAVGKFYVK